MGRITWNASVPGKNESLPSSSDPYTVTIPLDTYQPNMLRSDVFQTLERHHLQSPTVAKDLLRIATAVFACDVSFPRSTAYDNWTRHIRLEIPVDDLLVWNNAHPYVVDLLGYLTGDQWEVYFRSQPVQNEEDDKIQVNTLDLKTLLTTKPDAVCLLSGGMDSFIGASDKLAEGKRLTLVSHYGAGSASHASPAQAALKKLFEKYYAGQFQDFKFNVDPRRGITSFNEPTTRSRSLVFLSLGTLIAAVQQAPILYIPENGFITLNIPLTYSRLGSSSTRTTHPNTINLFQKVLKILGIDVTVENPYRYLTKGEMLINAQNQTLIKEGLSLTMSCAHPNVGRFKGLGIGHCGYCVPCIIRASAEFKAGFTGENAVRTYKHDVRLKALEQTTFAQQTGRDLRAFQIAILRAQQIPPGVAQVSRSGPLSSDIANISKYVDVYNHGLQEVEAFLNS